MFDKLIPKKGFAWRSGPTMRALIEALGVEIDRIQVYLGYIDREANPGTAISTQEEWHEQAALPYNSTKSTDELQAESVERYTALGDQDIVYLQNQITKAGFSVILVESGPSYDSWNECGPAECGLAECWGAGALGSDWIFTYYAIGEVDTSEDFERLRDLLEKLAPGHLAIIYNILIRDNVCGPAECGVAICDG